jgi:hypothetical protein
MVGEPRPIRVECVEHYCETLEGWCLGARTPHQLRGAHQMLLARRSTETEPPSATASLLLLRCALTMGKRASWFGHLPTHAPRDASAPERRYLVDTADALVALGVTVDRDAARVDAAQRYRVQVDALVGLTRTPNRFATQGKDNNKPANRIVKEQLTAFSHVLFLLSMPYWILTVGTKLLKNIYCMGRIKPQLSSSVKRFLSHC